MLLVLKSIPKKERKIIDENEQISQALQKEKVVTIVGIV